MLLPCTSLIGCSVADRSRVAFGCRIEKSDPRAKAATDKYGEVCRTPHLLPTAQLCVDTCVVLLLLCWRLQYCIAGTKGAQLCLDLERDMKEFPNET